MTDHVCIGARCLACMDETLCDTVFAEPSLERAAQEFAEEQLIAARTDREEEC